MNLYVVVEGKTEKEVYKNWIPFINKNITYVDTISDITMNNFAIITAGGYPCYFRVITDAIQDVNNRNNIDRLIVCADSEEMTFFAKYREIKSHIETCKCNTSISIVVQHFCFETWALGNQKFVPKKARNQKLRVFRQFYDVSKKDPEGIPENNPESITRVKFALRYLKLLHREKRLVYTKGRPSFVSNPKYCQRLLDRYKNTMHIKSIKHFFNALH